MSEPAADPSSSSASSSSTSSTRPTARPPSTSAAPRPTSRWAWRGSVTTPTSRRSSAPTTAGCAAPSTSRPAGSASSTGSTSGTHPTSTAVATLDEGGAASYVFDLHWDLPPVALPEGTTHVHTGSIATTLHPGDAEVTDALRRARPTATVSYDPNVRPTIMGGVDEVRARVEELVALSRRREVLRGRHRLAVCRPVGLAGHGRVGRPGRLPHRRDPRRRRASPGAPPPARRPPRRRRVKDVVDTVGAGDSFMAGPGLRACSTPDCSAAPPPASGCARRPCEDVHPAIDRALATSGVTVRHAGAYAPTRQEIR